MRIAILDDSASDRQDLRRMLSVYFSSRATEIEVCEYSAAADFLQSFTPGAFTIAFLDIYLGDENGMDAAQTAYAIDPGCRLVFFTASNDHAVDSYLVRAAYYLTKPVEQKRLDDALDVCCQDEDEVLAEVTVERVPARIPLKNICYVDCKNRDVRIHLSGRTLAVDESFTELSEKLLKDGRFLACNRGVLVNMEQVAQAAENDFVLKNGEWVPIRIRGRGELKKAYLAYSLQTLERGSRL